MTSLLFRHDSVWMRRIARIVLAVWLWPVLLAFLTVGSMSSPAKAQAGPGAQTAIVLAFAVSPGIDPLLGRKAADGLAVELQRSRGYDIVPRQRVEDAVAQQAGLQPPFTDTAQIRLAQVVNATTVFSGRVIGVDVKPGRSATVTIEVRQLDAFTADYVNGTIASEPAEQRLQPIANEILVDEAINKATFSAVRSMRQITLPQGKVLNTTVNDAEISIGARNGVGLGQIYSVLRDVYDRARNVTERVKIGEVRIVRVEDEQSIGRLSKGGVSGLRTGDYVRQIFVPGTYPVSTSGVGGNITPVTSTPALRRTGKSLFKGTAGKGIAGLLGLAALVGLAGFGGGGGSANSSPSASSLREGSPDSVYPTASLNIKPNFGGLSFNQTLLNETVIGYLVYRGTSAGFSPTAANLQAFVDARTNSGGNVSFVDDGGFGTGARSHHFRFRRHQHDGNDWHNGNDRHDQQWYFVCDGRHPAMSRRVRWPRR